MAKKKIKKVEKRIGKMKKQRKPIYEKLNLKQETMHIIYSAFFLLFSLFFIMAPFKSMAGKLGDYVYENLNGYFGIAYYVIPFIFLLISYIFIKGLRNDFTKIKVFGTILFVVSTLGFIDLVSEEGGSFGSFISSTKDSEYSSTFLFIRGIPSKIIINDMAENIQNL